MVPLTAPSLIFSVDQKRTLVILQVDRFAFGVNLMLAMGAIPFRHGSILVHVLDNLAPPHASIVGAERNFALLRGVRNDAHFSAPEVVIEQILEPHAGNKQEVPRVRAT